MFEYNYRSTDTEIVLYWDKPDSARPMDKFCIMFDGTSYETTKTHYTFSKLLPESSHSVTVSLASQELFSMVVSTGKTKHVIDVTKPPYNAAGDGKTDDSEAIQLAIDACGANDVVSFPKGEYLTRALTLHSNMELYLEEGALIRGSSRREDYLPKIHSRFEGYEMECYQSLINLGELDHKKDYVCENVVIRGKGSILGGGATLAKAIAKAEQERLKEYIASLGDKIKEFEKPETLASRARGRLINMSNCKNIWIYGLTLGEAASWNVHFIYSDNVVTNHCTFRSEGIWNGDGWDPDSSTNSTIFDCKFYTEDDSVAIKSGKNPEGNVINRPTKNIRVFDCVTYFGHGLCMGSEMSGGIDGVKIWDCEMGPTWSGIEIKATKKRGAYVRNVEVKDVTASHVQLHSVGYNDDGEGAKTPPKFENCVFERMHLLGRFLDNNAGKNEWHDCPAIDLRGFDVPGYEAENIAFREIEIENANGNPTGSINMQYCKNVTFEKISAV